VKVAGGQFDTHFRFGDRRIETIAHHAERCGAGSEMIESILREITAEATIRILRDNGLMKVFDDIAGEVVLRVKNLVGEKLKIHCILLSLAGEVLGNHHE
jgi:cobalt-precorrin-5B (C1)-methyltransferase